MQKEFKTAWMRSPRASGDKHEGGQVKSPGLLQESWGAPGQREKGKQATGGGAFKVTRLGFLKWKDDG